MGRPTLLTLALSALLFATTADGFFPKKPSGPGTLEGCVRIWEDFFVIPEMQQQYGPNAFQHVVVEHCPGFKGRRINVWKRTYYEFEQDRKLKQEVIKDWDQITPDMLIRTSQ